MLKLLSLGHTMLQLFQLRVNHGDLLLDVLHCHWYVALHYLYNTLSLSVSFSLYHYPYPTAATKFLCNV